jgi:drug/metabolite transporter (DMT)-like permease
MLSLFSSWQFLIGITILCAAVGTLFQRTLLKDEKSDPVAYSVVYQLIVAAIIIVFAYIHGFHMPDILHLWPNFLAMTVLYAATNILVFKSLSLIEASEFTVVFATRAVWTILAAVFFLGEHFTVTQSFGMGLLLVSVFLVSSKEKKFVFNKGLIFSLLAALTIGISFVNDTYIIRSTDVASYLVCSFSFPALLTLLFFPKSVRHIKNFLRKKVFMHMMFFSILTALGTITIYVAYQIARNAAQLGAVNQLATIVTVVLAIVFLRERSHFSRKIIGAILAFIGVVLIGG